MQNHPYGFLYPWIVIFYQCAAAILLVAGYGIFALWEKKHPWRPVLVPQWLRLKRHVGLFLISRWAIWLLFPAMAFGFAILVRMSPTPMGLMYQVKWHWIFELILGVFAMDLVMYVQHRTLHYIPWLWRVHRVHHMDTHLDATTALRFHPLEALFTVGSKIIGVAFFGIIPLAVVVYELMLAGFLFFAHMNVRFPQALDNRLRFLFVTPGMHRIHHSDEPFELNRNYGFCFNLWDKIIGSYCWQSASGYQKVVFGVMHYHDPRYQELKNMLLIPFNTRALKPRSHKPLVTQLAINTRKK